MKSITTIFFNPSDIVNIEGNFFNPKKKQNMKNLIILLCFIITFISCEKDDQPCNCTGVFVSILPENAGDVFYVENVDCKYNDPQNVPAQIEDSSIIIGCIN